MAGAILYAARELEGRAAPREEWTYRDARTNNTQQSVLKRELISSRLVVILTFFFFTTLQLRAHKRYIIYLLS